MEDLCANFARALAEAERQLHWGTDLARIERAACTLRELDPTHVMVRHLVAKVARLVAAEQRVAQERRAGAAPRHRPGERVDLARTHAMVARRERGLRPASATRTEGMRLQDLRALLADTPLFRNLDGVAFGEVVRDATIQRLPPDTTLFTAGEAAANLHVLLEGRVKVVGAGPSPEEEGLVTLCGPGDLVEATAVFRRVPHDATAVAVRDSIALTWTAARLFPLLERLPKLAANALAIVAAPPEGSASRPPARSGAASGRPQRP